AMMEWLGATPVRNLVYGALRRFIVSRKTRLRRKEMNQVTNQGEQAERLLPLNEAAMRLGVSIWTLRFWIQQGKVARHKLEGRRRMAESEVQRLIAASRTPARAGAGREANKLARKSSETLASAA